MEVSKPPIGALLIIVILIISLFIINTAVKQRDERRAWEYGTTSNIDRLDDSMVQFNNNIKEVNNDIQELNEQTAQNTQAIEFLDFSISQKTLISQPVAGCYGILPNSNSTLFTLMCDTEFIRK